MADITIDGSDARWSRLKSLDKDRGARALIRLKDEYLLCFKGAARMEKKADREGARRTEAHGRGPAAALLAPPPPSQALPFSSTRAVKRRGTL